jgi:glutamine synthetase
VDATSNPYLAFGAVIAVGLDGLRRRLDPGQPIAVDPGNLTDDERNSRGIDPLPTSLGQAIEQFKRDDVLPKALGPDLARSFLAVRQAEWEALKGLELPDEVKLLRERY